jgi:hypothetical protein
MKKSANIFTLTIILLFTISSCSTECDEPTKVPLRNLNAYVSYTGYDTLRFLHNNTDTQVFIGQGINYFWGRKPAIDDTFCPEDHESLSILFKNLLNENKIKMEYVYDWNEFSRVRWENDRTDFKFYVNGSNVWRDFYINRPGPTLINGYEYSNAIIYSQYSDTSEYIMYRRPYDGGFGGIIKIKQVGNILTLIR